MSGALGANWFTIRSSKPYRFVFPAHRMEGAAPTVPVAFFFNAPACRDSTTPGRGRNFASLHWTKKTPRNPRTAGKCALKTSKIRCRCSGPVAFFKRSFPTYRALGIFPTFCFIETLNISFGADRISQASSGIIDEVLRRIQGIMAISHFDLPANG